MVVMTKQDLFTNIGINDGTFETVSLEQLHEQHVKQNKCHFPVLPALLFLLQRNDDLMIAFPVVLSVRRMLMSMVLMLRRKDLLLLLLESLP